ncbi:ANTAR domain-containing protein [Streptomyces sp. MBT53]|uniref:ANTAR domain-containing protein n=1 Tax=Streptomyces sp. MBT53 TaxID=1488384 RepID=UPI0019123B2C|nr:ANTAR domain-containing protein [Streptomyces sp. MBT53]MBK6014042.1 ANTAR domain-containing protein [Streptomyces sp. MBT53]
MTSHPPLTVRTATGLTTIVCLSGALGPDTCLDLARELRQPLDQAGRDGQPLVLDMAGVRSVSIAACQALRLATDHLAHAPVLVVGAAPSVRAVLERGKLPGVRIHDTLGDALAVLPDSVSDTTRQRAARLSHEADDLRDEVFGLRARARTRTLIGVAQGILLARYGLPGPDAAFALLREGSQRHNVPLRVLASAVVTAPPPYSDVQWFTGRSTRALLPAGGFLQSYDIDAHDRRQVLAAALHEATVVISDAKAAELHLTDPAQDDALVLEQHKGLDAAYRDQAALVTGPPYVCARAQHLREPVNVPDVAADPDLLLHPAGRALLDADSRALACVPLVTPDGHCTGTLTLHWTAPGSWLTDEQRYALDFLATETAAWRSWYRRTVVLNALEYLHQHRVARTSPRER